MRLHTCYDGGAATTNDVSVKYADGAGNADTLDGLHIASLARTDGSNVAGIYTPSSWAGNLNSIDNSPGVYLLNGITR